MLSDILRAKKDKTVIWLRLRSATVETTRSLSGAEGNDGDDFETIIKILKFKEGELEKWEIRIF